MGGGGAGGAWVGWQEGEWGPPPKNETRKGVRQMIIRDPLVGGPGSFRGDVGGIRRFRPEIVAGGGAPCQSRHGRIPADAQKGRAADRKTYRFPTFKAPPSRF